MNPKVLIDLALLVALIGVAEHAFATAQSDETAKADLQAKLAQDDTSIAGLQSQLAVMQANQPGDLPTDLATRIQVLTSQDHSAQATGDAGGTDGTGDGSTTVTGDDGTITVTAADGTKTATKLDGTKVVTSPIGIVTTTLPDGTTTVIGADGQPVAPLAAAPVNGSVSSSAQ